LSPEQSELCQNAEYTKYSFSLASGSGKSTISSLLLRYYDPPSSTSVDDEKTGYIEFGGHDLRKLNLKWLRSQISIVSQEPQLFTASIFENVAYGLTGTQWEYDSLDGEKNLEEIRARVKEALEMACAWQFVSALPNGMDTVVAGGRNGVLSGGQRQRIAAARAFIRR
jgi:ATP-binding cassette, subfamily B (MDR/TAP), member 1